MMPFSPEYLRELETGSETGLPDGAGQSEPVNRVNSLSNLSSSGPLHVPPPVKLHSCSLPPQLTIVALGDLSGTIFISGFATVQVLKGVVSINGYEVSEHSSPQVVNSPIWQPALPVFWGSQADSKAKINSAVNSTERRSKSSSVLSDFLSKEAGIVVCNDQPGGNRPTYRSDLFSEFSVIMDVRCIPASDQEWLVQAEDQSVYTDLAITHAGLKRKHTVVQTAPTMHFEETDIVKLGTAMVGNYIGMTQHRADCMTLPVSWISAVDSVTSAYRSDSKTVKAVLCGTKGVGKSTCLRYTANWLLSAIEPYFNPAAGASAEASYAAVPALCVLDCDLGQPELSVSGSVSLHIVTPRTAGPFICAPHLNIHPADTSYFLGDVTSKNEPTLVLEYVRRLLARYEEIVKEAREYQEQQRRTATKKLVGRNAFNALALDGSSSDEDSEDSAPDKKSQAGPGKTAAERPLPPHIPLLVNLDGYVKNMGAEVLEGIVSMVQPTHALHIASDKDRALVPLEALLGLDAPATHEQAQAADGVNSPLRGQIHQLEPGRAYSAPRVAAVDLRTLRLVSYFLRRESSLSEYAHRGDSVTLRRTASSGTVHGIAVSTAGTLSRSTSAEKMSAPGAAAASSSTVSASEMIQIRGGAVVDPLGALAVALVSQAPVSVPFSEIVFATLPVSGDLAPRLMLAAFNASLVGMLVLPDDNSVALSTARLRHPSAVEFEITYASEVPVVPCAGMAIVRAVDVANQRVLLSTPVELESLVRPGCKLCLVKGANLQLPTALCYSPLLPVFPYMSSESTGEGSAQLRTRNNVKRRGQNLG